MNFFEENKVKIICDTYESAVGSGRNAVVYGTKYDNPYAEGSDEHTAWQYGFDFAFKTCKEELN